MYHPDPNHESKFHIKCISHQATIEDLVCSLPWLHLASATVPVALRVPPPQTRTPRGDLFNLQGQASSRQDWTWRHWPNQIFRCCAIHYCWPFHHWVDELQRPDIDLLPMAKMLELFFQLRARMNPVSVMISTTQKECCSLLLFVGPTPCRMYGSAMDTTSPVPPKAINVPPQAIVSRIIL